MPYVPTRKPASPGMLGGGADHAWCQRLGPVMSPLCTSVEPKAAYSVDRGKEARGM